MTEANADLVSFSNPAKAKTIPVGTRFGSIVVIGEAPPQIRKNGRRNAQSYGLCEDCGQTKAFTNTGLKGGRWKSCGCRQKENAAKGRITHGHAVGKRRSPELTAHRMMIRRCYDSGDKNYEIYGGRGIAVCERWRESFENFLDDMGMRPDGHSLDRLNPDGDYTPDNCRWASVGTQANNKRNNFKLEYMGKTITLAELAVETNLPSGSLRRRLLKGFTAIEAVEATQNRVRRKR